MNCKRDKSCLICSMLNLNPERPLSSFSEESTGRYFQNRITTVLKHEKTTQGNSRNPCGQPSKHQKPEFSNFSCRSSKTFSCCRKVTCPGIRQVRGKFLSEIKVALEQRNPIFNPLRGFFWLEILVDGQTGKKAVGHRFRLFKFITFHRYLTIERGVSLF